jgi:hypothetical protein
MLAFQGLGKARAPALWPGLQSRPQFQGPRLADWYGSGWGDMGAVGRRLTFPSLDLIIEPDRLFRADVMRARKLAVLNHSHQLVAAHRDRSHHMLERQHSARGFFRLSHLRRSLLSALRWHPSAQVSIVGWLFVGNRDPLGLQCLVSTPKDLDLHFSDFVEPFRLVAMTSQSSYRMQRDADVKQPPVYVEMSIEMMALLFWLLLDICSANFFSPHG